MYDVIYADPAWLYNDSADAGKRGAAHKYKLMPIEEIAQLPVARAANPDCALHLWATMPLLAEALYVMRHWGFQYKTASFSWVKVTKDGMQPCMFCGEKPQADRMGMGHYSRANIELVLIGTRGRPPVVDHGVKQVVYAPIQGHSVKPEEVRRRIERLHGPGKRLELFARRYVDGWDCWGLDLGIEIGKALAALPGQGNLPLE